MCRWSVDWEKTAGGENSEGGRRVLLKDRTVGDRVKERPTEFLECSAGFVQRGGCL